MARLAWVMVMLGLALPAAAQDREQTLADIRQELTVLYVEIQRLRREFSTTGPAGVQVAGSVLDRVSSIETELSRLTKKTEELEFRIDRVVRDGTNRIGDLEFRLVELEGGDLSQLGQTSTLGGEEAEALVAAPPPPPPTEDQGAELAMGEQADFDRAREALEAGEFADAAEQFAVFVETYPGGPFSGEAHYFRGAALAEMGQVSNAARAFLESFSGSPAGNRAPDALYRLGLSLGELGQTREACVTLGEVGVRFPAATVVGEARQAMTSLNCG